MNVACARRRDVERCAGARRREKRPVYRSVVLKIPVDTIASSTFGRFDALVGVSRITLTRGVAALDTINSVIDSRLSGVNNGNDPTRKGFERRVAFEVFKQQISADTRAIGAPRLVGENRNRWKARRTRRASFHYGRLINLTILPVAGFIDAKRRITLTSPNTATSAGVVPRELSTKTAELRFDCWRTVNSTVPPPPTLEPFST